MTMHHPNLQQHDRPQGERPQDNRPQAISRSYLDIRHVVKQFGSYPSQLNRTVWDGDHFSRCLQY
ncbi:hypothetical protein VcPa08_00505 [Vibrio cholerae]|nr:hypothetical protein [Vibrio cholerae]GFK31950.1 hypothetical protein VcPa01_00016 [Vibrio cholerae]GFK36182.1 hypothetical protein VcPa02_00714 [Vibrio cholerae]GFK38998.1 hypothetical protein VcPa03_00016 [Vibrio cholerae]GFK43270.1 hypothetical protein VcPa04_00753 [Vibrio cholerae]GFK46096.1 hypothetical protein VcPa05_00016 [Vibrio cholerae]